MCLLTYNRPLTVDDSGLREEGTKRMLFGCGSMCISLQHVGTEAGVCEFEASLGREATIFNTSPPPPHTKSSELHKQNKHLMG